MAKTEHYHTKFEYGNFYHIYNRSVDKQPLFKSEANFKFFLKKYDEYLSPVIDTYAYCLLGNHFHILIRIKEEQDLPAFKEAAINSEASKRSLHDIISNQFKKFFQSYAMAFNKQHQRVGTLFQTPFKRALVTSDAYFTQLIYYIHSNPQHHDLIADFRKWQWSSYDSILSDKPSKIRKNEVIAWFGNKPEYLNYHSELQKIMLDDKLILD
jgi:REP element-mobilizing transposase RayT